LLVDTYRRKRSIEVPLGAVTQGVFSFGANKRPTTSPSE
jgi:hypothetical protein